MDIRHPLTDFDNAMLDWAKKGKMPVHLLLTKSDKLKRGAAKNTLLKVRQAVRDLGSLVTVQTFSSLNGDGLDDLKRTLNSWLTPALTQLDEAAEQLANNDELVVSAEVRPAGGNTEVSGGSDPV